MESEVVCARLTRTSVFIAEGDRMEQIAGSWDSEDCQFSVVELETQETALNRFRISGH